MSRESLSFPDSSEFDSELVFADGPRVVPEYLALMMSGIKTERYTYQRAVELANAGMIGDFVGDAQKRSIKQHFEDRHGRD